MHKTKRGQAVSLGGLTSLVVILAVAVLATSLISGVITDVRTGQTSGSDINQQLQSYSNSSGDVTPGIVVAITAIPVLGVSVENVTNNVTLTAGGSTAAYSFNSANSSITLNVTAIGAAGDNVVINITSDQPEAAYNVSTQGTDSMLNIAAQYGNIGTVLAIVVIVGLLVGAFAAFRR